MEDVRIAVVTCNCPAGDVEGNLQVTEAWAAEAAGRKADIACFPELNISGYCLDRHVYEKAAVQYDHVVKHLRAMADQLGITIIAGTVQKGLQAGGFSAVQLVARPGVPVAAYHKLHIAPPEKDLLCGGDDVPIFDIPKAAFGIQLCYDAHFPELSSRMAVNGADILFFPHASPRGTPAEKKVSWLRHLPARAYDNSVFVIACNQSGPNGQGLEFPGLALLLGPAGDVMEVREGDDGVLVADLSAATLSDIRNHRMRYFLPHRRPELYRI
ncbi:MAG: nitrilase-related carbon-nitrogen hydrolase [Thermodesulfobacteriota bacterium]|nr:nitrilase-related carbon-nitrogen hydrolase [Thermodesulfobacteriota bacterium]